MLNRIFPQIKVLLALLFFAFLPLLVCESPAQAGFFAGITFTTPATDIEADRLVYYWDLRDRETIVQVTNTSTAATRIHVQVFDTTVGNNCAEFDFFDNLTAFDTHIYNVRSLVRNDPSLGVLAAPDLSGGHGIVAITAVTTSGAESNNDILTGNLRIRSEGFEYRTNAAGVNVFVDPNQEIATISTPFWGFNYNDVDSSTFADIVLVSLITVSSPGGVAWVTASYLPTLYDENEQPISCPETTVTCGVTPINYGINQTVINSRGAPSLCLGSDPRGHVTIVDNFFAGGLFRAKFIGLNNGDGTGSMDLAVGTLIELDGQICEGPC